MRPICNALIDEFIDGGHADLVRQFTFEFPTRVIARLLGLPDEDLPMLRPGDAVWAAWEAEASRVLPGRPPDMRSADYFDEELAQDWGE